MVSQTDLQRLAAIVRGLEQNEVIDDFPATRRDRQMLQETEVEPDTKQEAEAAADAESLVASDPEPDPQARPGQEPKVECEVRRRSFSLSEHAAEIIEIEHRLDNFEQQRADLVLNGGHDELVRWEKRYLPQVHALAQRIEELSTLD